MRFAISLLTAALAAVAAAVPQSGGSPSGNPIAKPGLNEQVKAGEPFTITWQPTTKGPVTLILLRGPSENVVPIDTIASGIPNSGKFVWTPSKTLENDKTHYGLKLVDDGSGAFQYSTQFGIDNPSGGKGGKGPISESSDGQPEATGTSHPTTKTETTATTTPTHSLKTTHTTASATAASTSTHKKTTATAPTKTSGLTTTTMAGAVASTGLATASGASISPLPSTAGGERVASVAGGAVAGVMAVALMAL